MNLESAFFSQLILAGGIFVIVGMILYVFPPKKINSLYGYRTKSSMKSDERWFFAQRYSAIAVLQSGIALMALSTFGLFYSVSETVDTIFALSLIAIAVALILIRTEKELKRLP